jgi:hypothetical protein
LSPITPIDLGCLRGAKLALASGISARSAAAADYFLHATSADILDQTSPTATDPQMLRRYAITSWLVGISLVSGITPSSAYELLTHAAITQRALQKSQGVAAYLQAIGIRRSDTFTQERPTDRDQLAGFRNTGTPEHWMIEGSIREDDYAHPEGGPLLGCIPPKNPPSQIDRPIHHFFDVQRGGRGLTVPIAGTIGLPGPDWALGRQGRGPNEDQNRFSFLDARDYQAQSLTASTRDARDRNIAKLFRALGQVVHVLEDMAQPQHTRNDRHAGCLGFLGGEHSW